MHSFLPSTPERFIDLNERQQLAEPDLRQTQFSIKQVAVSIQGIEQCIDAATVSKICEAFSILQHRNQRLPLSADLSDFLNGTIDSASEEWPWTEDCLMRHISQKESL